MQGPFYFEADLISYSELPLVAVRLENSRDIQVTVSFYIIFPHSGHFSDLFHGALAAKPIPPVRFFFPHSKFFLAAFKHINDLEIVCKLKYNIHLHLPYFHPGCD